MYVCHCGANIASVVDVENVVRYAGTLPNVIVSKSYLYMCSSPGQETIRKDIADHNLNRVVVAACTPRLHELTFRRAIEKAGLNPYLLEVANIREHCSWVHSMDPGRATAKAKDLARMSVARARLLEPLERKVVDATSSAMVIGGGVAGMRAAIDLAERGFDVYLVERTPTLGGRTAQLARVFPTEDYAESLVQRMIERVSSNPAIRVLTSSEVEAVDGFIGNFLVTVSVEPRGVRDLCDSCAKCETVCPIEVPDELDYGLRKRKAIYLPSPSAYPSRYAIDAENCNLCGKCVSACDRNAIDLTGNVAKVQVKTGAIIVATGFDPYEPVKGEFGYALTEKVITLPQFVRLLDDNGPTKGHLEFNRGQPRNVVFIACVGSRQRPGTIGPLNESQKVNKYCSRVCCATSLQNELELKRRFPRCNVFHLYRDIRTYGRDQEQLYEHAADSSIYFLRYGDEEPPVVLPNGDTVLVTVRDSLTGGEQFQILADLVVLAVGMIPRTSTRELQSRLKIPSSPDGFIQEAHAKLRPVELSTDGIFIAGAVQGPKDITESAISGSAAAAKAASILSKGRVELEPTTALVDMEKCDGCALCIEACSFTAISLTEAIEGGEAKKRAIVNDALCKGCGACAAICPPRAISVRHFTIPQITAVLDAALVGGSW